MELVLALGLFGCAMGGLSIGVILSDRVLSGSCGGAARLDEAAGACGACGKKQAEMCPSDDALVQLAQIAHPNPQHHH